MVPNEFVLKHPCSPLQETVSHNCCRHISRCIRTVKAATCYSFKWPSINNDAPGVKPERWQMQQMGRLCSEIKMSRLCRKTVKWFDIDSPFYSTPGLWLESQNREEQFVVSYSVYLRTLSPTQSRRRCISVSVINPLQSPPRLTWSLLNTNPDHQQWSPSLSDKIVFQCLPGAWCPEHAS